MHTRFITRVLVVYFAEGKWGLIAPDFGGEGKVVTHFHFIGAEPFNGKEWKIIVVSNRRDAGALRLPDWFCPKLFEQINKLDDGEEVFEVLKRTNNRSEQFFLGYDEGCDGSTIATCSATCFAHKS